MVQFERDLLQSFSTLFLSPIRVLNIHYLANITLQPDHAIAPLSASIHVLNNSFEQKLLRSYHLPILNNTTIANYPYRAYRILILCLGVILSVTSVVFHIVPQLP